MTTNIVDGRKVAPGHERREGFDVFRFPVDLDLRGVYFVSLGLVGKLMKMGAEIIHCQGFSTFQSDAAAVVSRTRNIPLVLTSHGFYAVSRGIGVGKRMLLSSYQAILQRVIVRNASVCISLTPNDVTRFLQLGARREKVTVIPNGIDWRLFSSLPSPAPLLDKYNIEDQLITFVGRLDHYKSPPLMILLESLGQILPSFPKAKLAIVGPDQGYLGTLKHLSTELSLDENVIFAGRVSDLEKLMFLSATTIGVVVSLQEAFPLTALDFMACGKPVIASRVGGLRFVIEQGYNGILVDNSKAQITRALFELLSDERKARIMGENGIGLTRSKYSWENVVDQLERAYSTCSSSVADRRLYEVAD